MKTFDFIDLNFIDVLDIFLVALLLFYVYRLVKGTAAINIFVGIVIVYLIWKLTDALNMEVLSNILGGFISVGVFALIVVFQQEIRKLLLFLGSSNLASRRNLKRYWNFFKNQKVNSETDVDLLIQSCELLSSQKTGALIVMERNTSLEFVKDTGDHVHLELSVPIFESIFFKSGPLHDGAAIVERNVITATRVVLPVSESQSIPVRFGLRHRAAVGITEKSDAVALVVSEETGKISYVRNGEFVHYKNLEDLKHQLSEDLG